jgi:protein-S-isoprenylcysteine O-methyltransferase Ste14
MKTRNRSLAEHATASTTPGRATNVTLRGLAGAGDRIGLLTLPFLVGGLALNLAYPWAFTVGGPPTALRLLSIAMLVPGVIVWAWSVALILTKVPRGQLITTGPYALVKHPLYTGVALLVLPWAGFLFNSWLGAVLGVVVYVGLKVFSPHEEAQLAKSFGPAWNDYRRRVKLPWL